jgi:very-short-patch-repair endonuclease
MGNLEIDSDRFHRTAADDHERDRLFKAHGISTIERFDQGECWENADGVVKKFLYLLRKQKR